MSFLSSKEKLSYIEHNVISLNNVAELKKVFFWNVDPVLDDPSIYEFESALDVNERRIRDAEVLGTIVANVSPNVCLEIGTDEGHSTALMAMNAAQAVIYTVNITPEEIHQGKGGKHITRALDMERIGSYYRQRNLTNIRQILCNSLDLKLEMESVDIAFIDGCHDADYVYEDSKKALSKMKSGAFIVWHDFNPELVRKYDWINSVCLGVENLYKKRLLNGRIYHVKDSWMGVYKVV